MFEKEQLMSYETGEDFLCREHTRNLFGQPDVLLVSEYLQVYQSNTTHTPEMRLIAAVLEDAIDCYIKYLFAKTRRGKRLCNEAEEWIFSHSEDWVFSFENICGMLKLEPNYIRRVLSRYKQERAEATDAIGAQLPEERLRLAS
jgi:hypothetical protein